MRGVVSLPPGFGHALPGTRTSLASANRPAVSAKLLTAPVSLDAPPGTGVANGIPVEASPV